MSSHVNQPYFRTQISEKVSQFEKNAETSVSLLGRSWSAVKNQLTLDKIAALSIGSSLSIAGYLSATSVDFEGQTEAASFAAATISFVCLAWSLGSAAKCNYLKAAKCFAMAIGVGSVGYTSNSFPYQIPADEINGIFRTYNSQSFFYNLPSFSKCSATTDAPYEALKTTLLSLRNDKLAGYAEPIILKHANGAFTEVDLLKVLGNGGCKRALEISGNQALIIPNMDIDFIGAVAAKWPRIAEEEYSESLHRRELGLLTLPLEKVEMCFRNNCQPIPAYVTTTFEHLGLVQGWSIVDRKNAGSSTYTTRLFADDESRLNPENWDSIVRPLIKDIENLMLHDFALGGDSVNLAVVKEPNSEKKSLRILGFDFTSKFAPLVPPEKRSYNIDLVSNQKFEENRQRAFKLLNTLVADVLQLELGIKSWFDPRPEQLSKEICARFQNAFLKQ